MWVKFEQQVAAMSPGRTVMSKKKTDVVQVKNPRSGRYVKIDRTVGKIIAHKKSEGPYKNVPIARKPKRNDLLSPQ